MKDVSAPVLQAALSPTPPPAALPAAAPTETGSDRVENQEQLERLRQAIRTLRLEEQEIFLLRQNGELTYEQIAEARSMPVGTVKTQMRSALTKLRKVLEVDQP